MKQKNFIFLLNMKKIFVRFIFITLKLLKFTFILLKANDNIVKAINIKDIIEY